MSHAASTVTSVKRGTGRRCFARNLPVVRELAQRLDPDDGVAVASS